MFLKIRRKIDGVDVEIVRSNVNYIEPKGSGSILHFVGSGVLETSLSIEEVKDLLSQGMGRIVLKKPTPPEEN